VAEFRRKLANLVTIRHHCECDNATAPPGEEGVQHVFQIDGVDFPWHITEHGPVVREVDAGLYEIDVTIFAKKVDIDGVKVVAQHADATSDNG
jgi:hypothetical protein